MYKKLTTIIALVFILMATGCGTKGYFINRRNDLADVFTCSAGAGVGAKVRLGPVNMGLPGTYVQDKFGLKNGIVGKVDNNGDIWLLIFGLQFHNAPEQFDRGKSFTLSIMGPPEGQTVLEGGAEQYTQLELLLALGPSIRVGFNPGELVDFVLGWLLLDLYHDDYWKNYYSKSTIQ